MAFGKKEFGEITSGKFGGIETDNFIRAFLSCFDNFDISNKRRQSIFLACIMVCTGYLSNFVEDGEWKYRCRGGMKVFGENNYRECGKHFGIDCLPSPSMLESLPYSIMSAGWYWEKNGMNRMADNMDYEGISSLLPEKYRGAKKLKEQVEFIHKII